MDSRSATRALHIVAAFALAAALIVPSLTQARADAQVPPLPPFPEQVNDLIQVTSPVAAPLCGNVIFANTIVIGTVPPELKEPLEVVTANIYAGCALIPPPANAPSRCLDQDVTATVLAQLTGTAIGGALPIAPPGGGQVIDAIDILLERYGGGDPGVVPALAAALACQAASTNPAPTTPTTPAIPDDDGSPPGGQRQDVIGSIGGPDGVVNEAIPAGGTVDTPSAFDVLPPQAQAVPASSRLPTRPVGYPIVVVPLVVAAVAFVIGRGLLSQTSEDG